ncbi:MAG TPA: hypothetical protein VMZ29_17380 [Candidatus Bathyarchaeia archaeon]|nr:hypothetical protein [Candidatus Bathyarchaeia archaeon]
MADDDKMMDFIFAFFLGFGIFRFFRKGYKTSGIVKFISMFFVVGEIWWFIDWIFVLLDKPLLWQK